MIILHAIVYLKNISIASNLAMMPTLTYLIAGHARLFISEKISTLDTLIRASPFINFSKIFFPPRLLQSPRLLILGTNPSSPFF